MQLNDIKIITEISKFLLRQAKTAHIINPSNKNPSSTVISLFLSYRIDLALQLLMLYLYFFTLFLGFLVINR